jgi:hypothetical protein
MRAWLVPFAMIDVGFTVMVEFAVVAKPGVIATVLELAGVKPVEVKLRTRLPTVPPMARSSNEAVPLASVAFVTVPSSVPPPEKISTVTLTPAIAIGLLPSSSNCTTGC